MADLFDNPMGLCGFEFVEFASPVAGLIEPLFEKMGFSLVAKHRSKDVVSMLSTSNAMCCTAKARSISL